MLHFKERSFFLLCLILLLIELVMEKTSNNIII
jgi:hypothetical protein